MCGLAASRIPGRRRSRGSRGYYLAAGQGIGTDGSVRPHPDRRPLSASRYRGGRSPNRGNGCKCIPLLSLRWLPWTEGVKLLRRRMGTTFPVLPRHRVDSFRVDHYSGTRARHNLNEADAGQRSCHIANTRNIVDFAERLGRHVHATVSPSRQCDVNLRYLVAEMAGEVLDLLRAATLPDAAGPGGAGRARRLRRARADEVGEEGPHDVQVLHDGDDSPSVQEPLEYWNQCHSPRRPPPCRSC
jgi:hypothetical protein